MVGQKGQESKGRKIGGQVFFAVAIVVFPMVSLVFEGVERFVLDFPPCAGNGDQFAGILLIDFQVGDSCVHKEQFPVAGVHVDVFKEAYLEVLVLPVEDRVIGEADGTKPAKTV